jgi:MFS family permease
MTVHDADMAAPSRRRRSGRSLPRSAAFWVVAGTTTALIAAAAAPSPLYPVYQAEFHFSALTLTAVFAVYVFALLLSLLTIGRLSDFLGRRPVLAVALLVEAGAMAALGVLGAYLLDLQPANGSRLGSLVNSAATPAGFGLGAALAGVLIQYAPHPTRLMFAILAVAFVALALITAVMPETVTRKPGSLAALRPQVSVPASARRPFLRAVPTTASTFMLAGLMFSIGGSQLTVVFGQTNHAIVGLVLGLFAGSGAVAAVVLRGQTPETMTRAGITGMFVGAVLFALALATSSLPIFLVGAVIAGAAYGLGFLGPFQSLSPLAQPHERAALISAFYVVAYLAFSIPALVAGLLITDVGLRSTSLGYDTIVALVVAGTMLYEIRAARRTRSGA